VAPCLVVCVCVVVQTIRAAADGPAAKAALVSQFKLSEAQAEGVLAMTLRWVCMRSCVHVFRGWVHVFTRSFVQGVGACVNVFMCSGASGRNEDEGAAERLCTRALHGNASTL
jgi:hypothetical protein